ncbi:hypothetical protein BDW69DRAFT_100985 [Aspergillus filifer]
MEHRTCRQWPSCPTKDNENSQPCACASDLEASEKARIVTLQSLRSILLARTQQITSLEHLVQYGRALDLSREAIQLEPTADSTLGAVFTLAIIEMVSCESLEDMQRSLLHLDAAVRIILQRNVDELQNKVEFYLILQLKFFIISQNLLRAHRVGDYLLEPTKIASHLQQGPEEHIDRLICILGSLSHLQADTRENKITNPEETYDRAMSILNRLLAWNKGRQDSYSFIRSPSTSEPTLPEGYNVWACHAMNHYQSAQLLIARILATYSSSRFSLELEGFGSDIRASVPFYLHFAGTGGSMSMCSNPVRGILLLWPLVATATTSTSVELRNWVKDCLRKIGKEMGVGQSLVLLKMIE